MHKLAVDLEVSDGFITYLYIPQHLKRSVKIIPFLEKVKTQLINFLKENFEQIYPSFPTSFTPFTNSFRIDTNQLIDELKNESFLINVFYKEKESRKKENLEKQEKYNKDNKKLSKPFYIQFKNDKKRTIIRNGVKTEETFATNQIFKVKEIFNIPNKKPNTINLRFCYDDAEMYNVPLNDFDGIAVKVPLLTNIKFINNVVIPNPKEIPKQITFLGIEVDAENNEKQKEVSFEIGKTYSAVVYQKPDGYSDILLEKIKLENLKENEIFVIDNIMEEKNEEPQESQIKNKLINVEINIKFKEKITSPVISGFDQDGDDIIEQKTFNAGDVEAVDVLDDHGDSVDIQFEDGAMLKGLPKIKFEIF